MVNTQSATPLHIATASRRGMGLLTGIDDNKPAIYVALLRLAPTCNNNYQRIQAYTIRIQPPGP